MGSHHSPPPRIDAGIFNVARPSYSPATMQLMKVLMEETRVPKAQQRLFQQSLRSGQPLPTFDRSVRHRPRPSRPAPRERTESTCGRRSQDTISRLESGQPPVYRPVPGRDRDAERERLAYVMTHGRDELPLAGAADSAEPDNSGGPPEPPDRFEELWREVEERQQFLQEMRQLGRADEYEAVIRGEVARIVKEMEQLQREERQ
ncbi:UPF0193 protein EVG1-like [Pollicipes pollicipes]|uniref:UPF0193 protein EVG1-like n=1 Tax=Pollicipes pollicipes TaxID=41117 RepID=UPI00188590D1|nr:UPF0193 protein EVG1-like [Pollicipes pollicipes]